MPTITITEFSKGITANLGPTDITAGPDGNLWFTEAWEDRIGRITPGGVVTEFSSGITPTSYPYGITAGPDGNLWFTEGPGRIGRITPTGAVTEFFAKGVTAPPYIIPGGVTWGSYAPESITAGPDGNIWFTESGEGDRIGRITTAGVITEFSLSPDSGPESITAGPDGNLWFTESGHGIWAGRIGRITTTGVVTEFSTGITADSEPCGITAGPDGNLWFTEATSFRIGRITTAGEVTEFSSVTSDSPCGITAGPDGNLWFTETGRVQSHGPWVLSGLIGRITTDGVVTEFSSGITPGDFPLAITAGSDGDLWFTEDLGEIGRVSDITAVSQNSGTHFNVTASTTSPLGGAPFAITVTALDANNAKAPYFGTVHFTSTDPKASLPADYTFTAADNGAHTFRITLNTSGAQTVTVTDTTTSTATGMVNANVRTDTTTTTVTSVVTDMVTPNQKFVGQLYSDLLGRPVDTSGLAFWSQQLDAGADRATVVLRIEHSQEFQARQVNKAFLLLLKRGVDNAGRSFFVTFLQGGGTDEQMLAQISGSAEYFASRANGNANTYVQTVFQDLLGRPLDGTGQTFFSQRLAAGATRDQITAAILSSLEYRKGLVAAGYQAFLRRGPDSGAADWARMLLQGATDEQINAGILSSSEYFNGL